MATSRQPWIGGNWKSNGSIASNQQRYDQLNQSTFSHSPVDVVIFPTFIHIEKAISQLNINFATGAQNCSMTDDGAFTGEVSAKMLKDMGVNWVLCGHSERRQLYNDTNECVAQKLEKALANGLHAVVCIGETLEERKDDKTMDVCSNQVTAIIPKVTDWSKIVIAYEPIWAIGTGVVASPEVAEAVHKEIRNLLAKKVSSEIASAIRIVYGGSVNAANSGELISKENIDGFLVGGASLKPEFTAIIQNVSNFYKSH